MITGPASGSLIGPQSPSQIRAAAQEKVLKHSRLLNGCTVVWVVEITREGSPGSCCRSRWSGHRTYRLLKVIGLTGHFTVQVVHSISQVVHFRLFGLNA